MISRDKEGATLGLIPFVILLITVIGLAWFYLAQFIGGNKQLVNGTDSGALGAAKQMLGVGLSSAEASALPIEFQTLGVDNTGTPISIDPTTGAPNVSSAIYNVYAFNRAAGYTLLVALNAAEDGSPTAIANANTLITALNTFGSELNADLGTTSQLTSTFANLADSNNTNMMGSNSSIALGNGDNFQFASVPGQGTGQANVYFNSSIYANDAKLQGWINSATAGSPTVSQKNSRYNASDPSAQSGQPFMLAYKSLDISAITGRGGFTTPIYASAVNPSQIPHMITEGRFNNTNAPAGCYAPSNAISAQGQITNTSSGNFLSALSKLCPQGTPSNSNNSIVCTALACAMLAAYDNQYPINLPFGWIRVQNGKDAIAANPAQTPALSPVSLWVDDENTIFNNMLYVGAGGGYGIYYSNAIDSAGDTVFCTEAYNNPNDALDEGPSGYSGQYEMQCWVNYTNSTGSDQYGHNPALDPSKVQANGQYICCNVPSPTCNMRFSNVYATVATVAQMRQVTSIAGYCNSLMYGSNTPAACANGINTWVYNYYNFYGPEPTAALKDTGAQPYGGLTNLEYLKAEVITQFDSLWEQTGGAGAGAAWDNYSFNLNVPAQPSGSKIYDHSGVTAYASPHDENTVAFGTVASPYALIQQLSSNQPSTAATNCADTSSNSAQWTDVTTPLGKLLQRCQMIVPSTTSAQLVALLSANTIDLNQYQYIYLPIGGTALAISTTPPPFLQNFPEYTNPGATVPDGSTILSCASATWDENGNGTSNSNNTNTINLNGSIINSNTTVSGQLWGDANTHAQPFETWSGNVATYDAMNWTSNSGRFYFLGQMSFGNYVSGSGAGNSFASPN